MQLRLQELDSAEEKLWLVVVLVLLSCRNGQESSDNQQQPNVLVILVDDLRPDLGSYGHLIVRSPGIDQFARQGMRFDRAYAQASVCNPSRASLLTGLRPNTTGVLNNRHSLAKKLPGAPTLPGLFQRENYFTARLGKLFHGAGRQGTWTDAGSWGLEFGPGLAGYQGRVLESGSVGRYRWRATGGRDERFVDARTTQKVITVLEERRDQPFFMMVGPTATHPRSKHQRDSSRCIQWKRSLCRQRCHHRFVGLTQL